MNSEDRHIDPVGLLPKVLSGEATSDEIRRVSEWISSSEENRKEYESFRTLWNITAPVDQSDIDVNSEWQKMEVLIEPSQRPVISLIRIIRIAASVILISALAFAGFRILNTETIKSPSSDLAVYDLPDGTKVSLNAGSQIIYKKGFGSSHRKLILKGEGFFEVEKSQIPFVVEAGEASVLVTGTKFNVSAYKNEPDLKVTVTEGSVRFYDTRQQERHTVIKAGETGIYRTVTNIIMKDSSVNPNDFAWRTRIIEFNKTPLSEVTDVLENTYHIDISLDTLVQGCTITVKFEDQEADSVLNVLKSTLDLNITRKGKQVLITGAGC